MGEINLDDTIAAIATPLGEGGISVVRLSGPESVSIADKVCVSGKVKSFESHTIHLDAVKDANGKKLDQVLVSVFKGPHSYTGEDVVELSGHGGILVTKKVLEALTHYGARHAEPGEFTKRAFLNGKMDLTQAEAVLDLIHAKSELSQQSALSQLEGSLSRRLDNLKSEFMNLYAHMEAYIDFPEDQLEIYENPEMLRKLDSLASEIEAFVASFSRGSLIREGILVALAGKPNVGKSSLFNALLERDRALVSELPGTTRDHLEEALEIGGMYIKLVDTAGLASDLASSPLDQMGMQRTREALGKAQLILYLLDGSSAFGDEDLAVWKTLDQSKPVLIVINKTDLPQKLQHEKIEEFTTHKNVVFLSTKTREGLGQLEAKIADIVSESGLNYPGEQITRLRHKNGLERALKGISATKKSFLEKKSMEFVAADLKDALDALQELVGEVYSEDLLDVIFAEFCIGK